MADDTRHAAVAESLKATASELQARPHEDMNQDWADRMDDVRTVLGRYRDQYRQDSIALAVVDRTEFI